MSSYTAVRDLQGIVGWAVEQVNDFEAREAAVCELVLSKGSRRKTVRLYANDLGNWVGLHREVSQDNPLGTNLEPWEKWEGEISSLLCDIVVIDNETAPLTGCVDGDCALFEFKPTGEHWRYPLAVIEADPRWGNHLRDSGPEGIARKLLDTWYYIPKDNHDD